MTIPIEKKKHYDAYGVYESQACSKRRATAEPSSNEIVISI